MLLSLRAYLIATATFAGLGFAHAEKPYQSKTSAAAASSSPVPPEKKRPNSLFIIADDQSPFELKTYNPQSTLDTLTLIDTIYAASRDARTQTLPELS